MTPEAQARQTIDQMLTNSGWQIQNLNQLDPLAYDGIAVREYPTDSGPADYALFVRGKLLGVMEAKKKSVGSQNVLEQAKRYARGIDPGVGRWGEYRVPFLYSTNAEQHYFLDVRFLQNISRAISRFHTPDALWEFYQRNENLTGQWLQHHPVAIPGLRPYQQQAVEDVEKAITNRKWKMLVAMATGTGKTFMAVSLVYRLLKSGQAKRILFLVDRKALAAQTTVAYAAFTTPAGLKFNQEYEVYSQRFRKDDLDSQLDFDPKVLPNDYLTKPDAAKTFVYISTIQRMAINLYGKSAGFDNSDNDGDDDSDADKLDIPIHAFDIIIADECHRGYTSHDENTWRRVLEHFDATKIGLTATPALHTTSYFGEPVSRYTVEDAIEEGYLVDYEAVKINSTVRLNGVFLREGERVGKINPKTGHVALEDLEDERSFDAGKIEREITSPDSNRKIIGEFARYALAFEQEYGRFPKTLIFAVNDVPFTSHADEIVRICKETFNRGDDFVLKITGNPNVDRPLEKIKRFRNRPEPMIVVTVDMLSTGVDIPALENIVFLRPVKSRILWEQMLGRGTRLCKDINKEKFTVFDCFGGTLIAYFKDVSNFTFEGLTTTSLPVTEVIRRIDNNEERDYNAGVFVRRLRRIEKTMSSAARDQFAPFVPDGDIGRFADQFRELLKSDFTKTMAVLNDRAFQKLLTDYPHPTPVFYVAHSAQDEVTSDVLFESGERYLRPTEYLQAFADFVRANQDQVEAVKIVLERPQGWRTAVLNELRLLLQQNDFPEKELRKAHQLLFKKNLPDLISMLKHAAHEEEPVLEAAERADRAVRKLFDGQLLTPDQQKWVGYLQTHLEANLTIERDDFDDSPVLERNGGWGRFRKVFPDETLLLLTRLNEAIAA